MPGQFQTPSRFPTKKRIDTQIHRRRAAPASGSMESEWDVSQGKPPSRLKMMPAPAQPRTEERLGEYLGEHLG